MDFYKKHFGKNLRRILDDLGQTQEWLAEEMGVQQSTVNRWVNGRDMPSDERAEKIAAVVGMTFEELVTLPSPARQPLSRDRRALQVLILEPDRASLKLWARLLEEFQGVASEIRAASLATLFSDPQLLYDYGPSDMAKVPPKLLSKFQLVLYSDPIDAVFKAVGVE